MRRVMVHWRLIDTKCMCRKIVHQREMQIDEHPLALSALEAKIRAAVQTLFGPTFKAEVEVHQIVEKVPS